MLTVLFSQLPVPLHSALSISTCSVPFSWTCTVAFLRLHHSFSLVPSLSCYSPSFSAPSHSLSSLYPSYRSYSSWGIHFARLVACPFFSWQVRWKGLTGWIWLYRRRWITWNLTWNAGVTNGPGRQNLWHSRAEPGGSSGQAAAQIQTYTLAFLPHAQLLAYSPLLESKQNKQITLKTTFHVGLQALINTNSITSKTNINSGGHFVCQSSFSHLQPTKKLSVLTLIATSRSNISAKDEMMIQWPKRCKGRYRKKREVRERLETAPFTWYCSPSRNCMCSLTGKPFMQRGLLQKQKRH